MLVQLRSNKGIIQVISRLSKDSDWVEISHGSSPQHAALRRRLLTQAKRKGWAVSGEDSCLLIDID